MAISTFLGKSISFFLDKLIDALFERFRGFVSNQKEKAQLKYKLSENFERYFRERYEYLPLSQEFDLHSLQDHLIENLYTSVALCFIAASSEERSFYKDSLINSSYKVASADTKAKQQGVYAYVDSFLKIIEDYFLSKVKAEDLFLVNQQTEDIKNALAAYIHAENKKLKEFIKYHGSFAEFIDSIKLEPFKWDSSNKTLDQSILFHYLNPEIGFVRRNAQFKYLDDFLDDDAPLLSLAITGYGGIGKSKLLHRYILELLYNLEWKAVILDGFLIENLFSFKEWNYPKNLLLVIDYAAEKSTLIGEWMRAIYLSNSCPPKMRIILLERQGITRANEQTVHPLWYQQIYKASGKLLAKIQYRHGNGFYELPRFNQEEMFQVMDMLPGVKSKLTPAEKENIYKRIVSFASDYRDERFNTPLIALLLADAYMNGEDVLDPERLMSYVIERNRESWKRAFASYSKQEDLVSSLERALVYVTATGGCDLTDLPPPLTADGQLLINTLGKDGVNQLPALIAGDVQQHHQLEPLKPDIVGEYFVLNYIDRNCYSDNCKQMIEACWEKSEEFLPFLIRCVRSYLGEFPDLVFGKQPILFCGARPFDQALVLFGMTTLSEITICQKALKHIEGLYQKYPESQLAEVFAMCLFNLSAQQEVVEDLQSTAAELKALSDMWPEVSDIALEYTKGLVNLSLKQDKTEARKTVFELKAIHEQWPEVPEIALRYANGLVNLSLKQDEVEARQTVAKLKATSDKWPETSEIALEHARGLVNLSTKQDKVEASRTITELKAISERWPEVLGIALRYANGLVNLSAAQDEVEALLSIVTELKAIYKSWPEAPEIALRYANGLVNLSAAQDKVEARRTVAELKAIHEQWSEVPEIALRYADGLVNLSIAQDEVEAHRTIAELKAIHKRWPEVPEISLRYANALVNLSIEQDKIETGHTVSALKAIHERLPAVSEIALEYAKGLFNLSVAQEEVEARQTISALKAIHERWPAVSEITLRYANALVNLFVKQDEVEALQLTAAELKELCDERPEILENTLRYAKMLVKYLKEQNGSDAMSAIAKLEYLIQSLETHVDTLI